MASHFCTTLVALLIQSLLPVVVVSPVTMRFESASVAMVTSLVESGLKLEAPLAVKVSPVVTVRLLLTVVVPEFAPKLRAVAAPPTFKVVTVELNKEAVVVVEVISADPAPLTAKSPLAVTLPVRVDIPSIVKVPLAWILPVLLTETPVEP